MPQGTMVRALALLALLAGASAVELSHYNFKESVQGEKSAFIKFLAPWQAPPHPTPSLRALLLARDRQMGLGSESLSPCPLRLLYSVA